jgi:DnaJ homolog subfamily C member 9
MDKIFQDIMLSNPLDDEDRFCTIFDKAIKEGEIKPLKKYTEEPKKKKERRLANARREAEEAEGALQELQEKGRKKKGTARKSKKKGSDDGDLVALIQQRQKSRAANFFDDLEAKYSGSSKGSRKRGSEPLEEAFAEVAARASKKQKQEGDEKPKKRVKPTKVA